MFTVYMKMEDGTKLVWEGTADDPNHEQWYGRGWIKELGGDDIAKELNEIRKQAIAEIKQFKADHFHFIHIK